jgi:hypothetical protein
MAAHLWFGSSIAPGAGSSCQDKRLPNLAPHLTLSRDSIFAAYRLARSLLYLMQIHTI